MKKLLVLKIGGKIIDNQSQLLSVLKTFANIKEPKILIHGGGSKATKMEKTLGIEPIMLEGRRITNADSLAVVTMVYAGLINKNMVANLQGFGCNALGLSGADGNAIKCKKRAINPINYGFVGDIKTVNSTFISFLIKTEITPIFSAITHDGKGQLLNTNADTMAAEIAIAMSNKFKVELIFAFEKEGVFNAKKEVMPTINELEFKKLKKEKVVIDGMIPKLTNAFSALKKGVKEVKLTSTNYLADKETPCTNVCL